MPKSQPKSSSGPPEAFDASGAFETCRVKAGRVVHIDEHLHRLRASLRTVGISSWKEPEVRAAVMKAARRLKEGYLRVAVRRAGSPRILIHASPRLPYPEKPKPVSVKTVPTRWPAGDTAVAGAKVSERLGSILARIEGEEAAEALRIGPHGYVTEGTVSNLFFVKDNTLVTPPVWVGVLEGVTRHSVLQIAAELNIPVREAPFTRHELFNADEAFLTNVLMGILPVGEVDGRKIGRSAPGPVTLRLIRSLRRSM